MEAKPGVVVAGCYELLHELARGGMGSVWSALNSKLEEQVAIKFMDRELALNADARARFEREAKAAAKLRSPHVVQILDYGVDGETPFIVMELLEGQDLRTRLKQRGRLSLAEAQDILVQACKALRLAADAGIVHRDIKPGNVFLARSGDDEMVKVLDFGVAKATRRPIGPNTSSNLLLGSPHYMSPEQARSGATVDHRGDLWSMAVILFQMITGRKPFVGSELGDVIVKICTEPAPRVSMLVPSLPETLDHFFDRALAKDPDARFQSARSLASEFAAIVRKIDGAAAVPISQPGERSAHDTAFDSFPGDSWRELESSQPSGSGQVRITDITPAPTTGREGTPAPQSAGTLTVATRSLPLPRPKSRRTLVAGIVAALVAFVAVVALFLREGSGDVATPAAAAQPSEIPSTAASASEGAPAAAPSSAVPPSPETASTTEGPRAAETESAAPSATSHNAGAHVPATKSLTPPTHPQPGDPQHPVLGF